MVAGNRYQPYGRAVFQTVCHRLLTERSRLRSLTSAREICGGQRGTRTGFFRVLLLSFVSVNPQMLLAPSFVHHRPYIPLLA
jgi:IS5 family transposase